MKSTLLQFIALLGKVRRLIGMTGKLKWFAFGLSLLFLVQEQITLIFTHGIRLTISAATEKNWDVAWEGFYILVAGCVISLIFRFSLVLNTVYVGRVFKLISYKTCEQLQRLSMAAVNRRYSGDVSRLVDNDCNAAVSAMSHCLTNLISIPVSGLVTILYLGITIDWTITLVAVGISLLSFLSPVLFGKRLMKLSKKARELEAQLSAYVRDMLGGIEIIKAYNAQLHFVHKMTQRSTSVIHLNRREEITRAGQTAFQFAFTQSLCQFTVLLLASHMAFKGEIDAGELAAFAMLSNNIYQPFSSMTYVITHIMSNAGSFDRLMEIFDEKEIEADAPRTKQSSHPFSAHPEIRFDKVEMSYTSDAPALQNLDLEVDAGKIHVLTGPSGSGKSSILSSLLRLYPIQKGTIRVDDQDVCDIDLQEYRNLFGIVTQDPYLFDTNVRDNLLYAKPDATEEDILQAIELAGAKSFIDDMPEGLDTPIRQRGERLSIGQRQRIAIARAFIKDAPILILDEPTASLDMASERDILEALSRLAKGKTTIFITHRLSIIKWAHRISIVEKGRIKHSGNHKTLLEKSAIYRQICEHQELSS